MGKKSLRDRLAESAERSETQESAKRLALFLKHWEEISEAYREGWSYKEIWRVMHRDGLLDFSYSSFLNFARKLKRRQIEFENEKRRKAGNAATAASASKAGMSAVAKSGAGRGELPRFGQETAPRDPKRF